MNMMVEMAPIRLAPGKTEADLVAASETFQQAFLAVQPGFVRRELLRRSEREFIDVVHWRSAADAEAIMHKVAESEACARYFSVMQMPEDGDATAGVEHLASVAIYG